jgi:hypothetical protein
MTHQEIIKLAAKAAYTEQDGYYGPSWNPIDDDGDVFRLLLVLNEFEPYKSRGGFRLSPGLTPEEARRAIVHAAAEIGRSK